MDAEERLTDERAAALRPLLAELNAGLGEFTPYKLDLAPPGDLLPTPKNAHYMPKRVFDLLTENVRRDGNLSTLPLCWRRADGRYELLSGNHRVESAKAAGVPYVLLLYTDQALSQGQRVAVQLSHNALVGQDNPSVLRELWNQIDALDWKVYSGLDEELLATLAPVQVARVTDEPLRLEELTILFLPSEVERVKDVVKRLGKENRTRRAARYEEWEAFFDALLDFKQASGILNTGTAFAALIDIARDWIDRQEAERRDAERQGAEALCPP